MQCPKLEGQADLQEDWQDVQVEPASGLKPLSVTYRRHAVSTEQSACTRYSMGTLTGVQQQQPVND